MVIKVYTFEASPPGRAVMMTVEILGLKVECKEVKTIENEHLKPEYLEKNPARTIPLLEDGDFLLPDSHVIIAYLVSKYGADLRSTLYPNDLRIKSTIDHRMYIDATKLDPTMREVMKYIVNNKASGPTEEQTEKVHELYGLLEKYLGKIQFLAADHITIADISVVATISSIHAVVPVEAAKFPKLTEWWKKLKSKDWYIKANLPGETLLTTFLKDVLDQNAKNN